MASRSETFKLRLTTEELAGYHAGAAQLGMDVSSWIRLRCAEPDAGTPARSRKTMCEHRRRPDQFCNRCD